LLLDQNFSLKIADFGFAGPVDGRDGSGYLTTTLGTMNYMAPEIHMKLPYQGPQVDLFAAAIILFIMVSGHPPFVNTMPEDKHYKCLAANRADLFWKIHCKTKGEAYFSDEFKDLVQSMLQLDPTHRPSLSEVFGHPWMQGETPSQEEVKFEFEKRDKKVKESQQKEKEHSMESQKRANMRTSGQAVRAGGDGK